jgi:hypothetical protein
MEILQLRRFGDYKLQKCPFENKNYIKKMQAKQRHSDLNYKFITLTKMAKWHLNYKFITLTKTAPF